MGRSDGCPRWPQVSGVPSGLMAKHVFASIYMIPASLWVSFSRGEERYYLLAPQSKTKLPMNPHADTALQDHRTPEGMAKPARGGWEQGGGGRGDDDKGPPQECHSHVLRQENTPLDLCPLGRSPTLVNTKSNGRPRLEPHKQH